MQQKFKKKGQRSIQCGGHPAPPRSFFPIPAESNNTQTKKKEIFFYELRKSKGRRKGRKGNADEIQTGPMQRMQQATHWKRPSSIRRRCICHLVSFSGISLTQHSLNEYGGNELGG